MASPDEGAPSLNQLTGPAFTEAYTEHRPALLKAARQYLPPHEAEEVVHETFVAYFLDPGRHDPARGPLLTYLRMVTRGRALDRLRSREAARRRDAAWAGCATPVFDDWAHDRREDIVDALRHLPPPQREAIVTAFYGGLTYSEAAAALGVPEGTVKTRIRTGLARLRDLLATASAPPPAASH